MSEITSAVRVRFDMIGLTYPFVRKRGTHDRQQDAHMYWPHCIRGHAGNASSRREAQLVRYLEVC